MTPQAGRFLDKARELINQAKTMAGVGLNEAAGRTAYLAGYHAAQALIFERTGKLFKTHGGVQTEFLRLTKDDPGVDGEVRGLCRAPTISKRLLIMRPVPAQPSRLDAQRVP